MSKICVLFFTDGRNDYLKQTLDSFFDKVKFPEKPYFILIDDNPQDRDTKFLEGLKKKFKINKMILNGERLGIFGAVQEAWRNVPKDCEFIYHQENDFTYNEEIDINILLKALSNRHIFQICLLRQAWYENEIQKGGIYQANPGIFKEANYANVNMVLHRGFFSHNPCLYKSKFANPDFANYNEYTYMNWLKSQDSNGWCAYLGKLTDAPKVTHIGKIKI